MTIQLLTFRTNQTLIGVVEKTSPTEYTIKKPVQVVVQPSKDGPVMGFAPFLEYCEEFATGITVPAETVLCITSPVRELENQYNQVFGSGIQIASSIPTV